MNDTRTPRWTAPPTLLPRVMNAVLELNPRPQPVTPGAILTTVALCGGVGLVIAMIAGLLPMPSTASGLNLIMQGSELLLWCQRICSEIISVIMRSQMLIAAAATYLFITLIIGLCSIRGLIYLFNMEPLPIRSTL